MPLPTKQTPQQAGALLLGSLASYRRDPLKLFLDSALESSEIVRFRMGYLPLFLIVEPRYIRHVLQENQRNYVKGVSYESLRILLGDGLLTAEGDLWRRQRRLIQPAFHRQTLVGKLDLIAGCVQRLVDRLDRQRHARVPFDLVPR